LGEARLKLDNVSVVNGRGSTVLKNVSFEVHSGEIVGVAGVSGNGQRPLAEAIAGLANITTGQLVLQNQDVTNLPPAKMIEAGLSYIPEERMHDGAIKDFSVAENLILQDHVRQPYSSGIFLNFKAIGRHAQDMIRRPKTCRVEISKK